MSCNPYTCQGLIKRRLLRLVTGAISELVVVFGGRATACLAQSVAAYCSAYRRGNANIERMLVGVVVEPRPVGLHSVRCVNTLLSALSNVERGAFCDLISASQYTPTVGVIPAFQEIISRADRRSMPSFGHQSVIVVIAEHDKLIA